jgi:hypothetical protein
MAGTSPAMTIKVIGFVGQLSFELSSSERYLARAGPVRIARSDGSRPSIRS